MSRYILLFSFQVIDVPFFCADGISQNHAWHLKLDVQTSKEQYRSMIVNRPPIMIEVDRGVPLEEVISHLDMRSSLFIIELIVLMPLL